MRSMFYGVLGIIIGIGLFVGGVASSGDNEVKCGSRTMSPGDTCTTIRNGSSTERSYAEQKSKNGREGVIMMIIGPLVAIGGVVLLAGSSMGRRRRVHHPAHQAAHGAPPPAPYGAHPAHPAPYPPAAPAYPPAPPAAQPAYPPAPPAAQPGYPPAPSPAQPGYPPPPAQPYPPQPPPGGYPYHG